MGSDCGAGRGRGDRGTYRQPRITGRRVREVWISKKKWQALEKRVADLEGQVQGQLKVEFDAESLNHQIQERFREHPEEMQY